MAEDDVVWTNKAETVRIVAAIDTMPEPPYFYGAMPTLQVDKSRWGCTARFIQGEDLGGLDGDDLVNAYHRFYESVYKRGNEEEAFLSWLKVFHGTTTHYAYGPNPATDYTYLTFDTCEWRKAHEVAEDHAQKWDAEASFGEYRAYLEGDTYVLSLEHKVNRSVCTVDMATGEQRDSEVEGVWEEVESIGGYYGGTEEELAAWGREQFGIEEE